MVPSDACHTVIERLIRIGYWVSPEVPDFPDPSGFIDAALDNDTRETIADYLRRGVVVRAYLGESTCRICGRTIGSLELSDGSYVWPEGLAHYVEAHHVRLPDRFVEHVDERTRQLEEADVDDAWWRSQGNE